MILALVIILLTPILIFVTHALIRLRQLPPGPYPWQFLASIAQFGKHPHVAFANLAKAYGPLMSIRLGSKLVVVASSPATAMEILKTHDRSFSGRYLPSLCYKVPQARSASLTMSKECNETWRFLRGISQKCVFSSKAVDSSSAIRQVKVMEMINYLSKKEGSVVNIEDVLNATIINMITSVLASIDLFDFNGELENNERVRALVDEIIQMVAIPGLGDLFPLFEGVDIWSKRKAMDVYGKMKFLWGHIIKERRMKHKDGITTSRDFLDILIQNGFSDDQIQVVLSEVLIAGTDTTTSTAVWLMVELIRDQNILHRVRLEIAEAVQGDFLSESCLSQLHYFQTCIKETLRIHIPGPFLIPHRAIESCKVNGYRIPKDSIILVNAWAIAMDSSNWKSATSFKPERFIDSKVDYKGKDFDFIPFSAGRRMCPGSNVAVKNVQLVAATLLHYFDWSLPDGLELADIDTKDKFGTILKKEKPLCIIPRLRVRPSVV